jgi:hypothetical protein
MYYSYVEIEYVAMSFSPARTDLALKLLNLMSANHRKEDGIFPLITIEIAKNKRKITRSIQKRGAKLSKLDWHFQLIKSIIVLYKDENQSSQHLYKEGNQLVSPLPNPSHSHLKETMRSVIYRKGIHNTLWS